MKIETKNFIKAILTIIPLIVLIDLFWIYRDGWLHLVGTLGYIWLGNIVARLYK